MLQHNTFRAGPISRPGKFWSRLALFWLPVWLVLAGFEYLFWHTGESWPLEKVAAEQLKYDALFMREFLPQDQLAFKLHLLSLRKPRVLVLSSSRGMQLRAEMVGETRTTFLNGGGILNTVGDFEAFPSRTPQDQRPQVVLLAVDLWWFNEHWPGEARKVDRDGAYEWRAHLSAIRKSGGQPALLKSLLFGPAAPGSGLIGISALRSQSGFRVDGSIRQVVEVPADPAQWKFEDREHPPVIDRVRAASLNFQESHELSAKRMARFEAALAHYKRQGIAVAAFAPPLATEVYRALTTDPRHADFFSAFQRQLPETFARAGVPYFDASNLALLGLDDRYMYDGFHAAETFHLHLLRKMLDTFPEMNAMLPRASQAVDTLLHSGQNNFYYVGLAQTGSSKAP